MQPTVKKMFCTGHHDDRQFLRSSPVQHCFQRDCFVLIAMNYQNLGRMLHVVTRARIGDMRGVQALNRWRYQYHFLRLDPLGCIGLDRSPEGKSRQQQWCRHVQALSELTPDGFHYRKHILRFFRPIVLARVTGAFTLFYSAKIEFDRYKSRLKKRFEQGVHNLVVHGSAIQRMRVCDHRNTAGRTWIGFGKIRFQLSCRTINE